MATPEEKYHDAMNTLLAPVGLITSLIGTIGLALLLIGMGVAYPLTLYFNGKPVTAISFAVSFLTILAVFTMFYAPYYFFGFGFLGLVTFGMLCEHGDVDTNAAMAFFASGDGWTLAVLIFAFLTIGIVQRYIRHRLFDPPKEAKPRPLGFVDQLNQVRHERCTREYDALNPEYREAMIRKYGENYLSWPELDSPEAREVISHFDREHPIPGPRSQDNSAADPENSANGGNELSEHYATLGIGKDATPQEVKQAYRDLAKVWHPDRFDVGDTRFKQKAEEQLKAINDAYAHIQEAQSQPSQSDTAIERIPLREAVLETDLFISTMTAKMTRLQMMMFPGFKTKEEVAAAIQDCLSMCKEGITRLKALIGRIEREAPQSSVAGLERSLASMVEQQAELEGYAAAATRSRHADMVRR